MKRTLFGLIAAAAMVSSQAVAADMETSRSAGAHPVVMDDYPEAALSIEVGQDIVLTITGEARTRFEWIENTYDFSSSGMVSPDDDHVYDDSVSFAPARFNLGMRVDLPRDVAAVIELQSNFELGGRGESGGGAGALGFLRPGQLNGMHGYGYDGYYYGDSSHGHYYDSTGFGGAGFKSLGFARDMTDGDGDGVSVYQGYIETAHVGDSIFSMRFGRQEMAYGTEWLLGNQDWYDGQSYDGIKGIFEFTDKHRLDLFWAKLEERDTLVAAEDGGPYYNQGGDDVDMFGAYFTAQSLGGSSIGMDAYAIGVKDGTNLVWNVYAQDAGIDGYDAYGYLDEEWGHSFMESYWVGVRFFREREHGFTFSAEATYQFGSIDAALDNDDDGEFDDDDNMSIGAWGFESFLAYTWDTPTNPSIKGGLTYATGSDGGDLAGGSYNTFFTPGGEIHPRLGLMDLVDASNIMAVNLGYAGSSKRHSWGVDLWHFELDNVDPFLEGSILDDESIDEGHDFSNELGQELDLWYNYQYSEHMLAQFAVSYFNAGNYIEEANRCWDDYGYCDLTDDKEDDDVSTSDAWRVYANLLVRF